MTDNCFICGWEDDPNLNFCQGCWHPKSNPAASPVTLSDLISDLRAIKATNRATKATNRLSDAMAKLYQDQMAGDEAANAFVVHATWDEAAVFRDCLTEEHSMMVLDDDPEIPVRFFEAGSMSQWLVVGDFDDWAQIAYLPYFGGVLDGDGNESHNSLVIEEAFAALRRQMDRTLNEARELYREL